VHRYFNAESDPALQTDIYLDRGDYSAAIYSAYVLNEFSKIQDAVKQAASQEESLYDYGVVDALDRTLLFEAEALFADGSLARAQQKHAFYLSLIRSIDAHSIDEGTKNLSRRLTLTRLRQFQIGRNLEGDTPYLDRIFATFFEDFDQEFPYESYELYRRQEVALPSNRQRKIEYFDSCLYMLDAHQDRPTRHSECAITFETEFGKDFLSLVLRYADIHYRLVHTPIDQERADTSEMVELVNLFIADVSDYGSEANFLVDDIVYDIVGSTDENDGNLVNRWDLNQRQLRMLLCDTHLISPSSRLSYDQFDALVDASARRDVSCP